MSYTIECYYIDTGRWERAPGDATGWTSKRSAERAARSLCSVVGYSHARVLDASGAEVYKTVARVARSARCVYCGAHGPHDEPVPAIGDESGWTRIARWHRAGCEWIETRAHRIG